MSYLKKLNNDPELLKKFKGLPTTEEEIEALKTISNFTKEQLEALKNLLPTEEERENSNATTLNAHEEVKLLREEIKQLKTEKKSEVQKTTLPKQLLILYYLGQLNPFDLSNVKNSKLLSILLNGNEQNIRTSLSDFLDNQLRSKSALTHLMQIKLLFEEVGLFKLMQIVEKDIVRVKEKKL